MHTSTHIRRSHCFAEAPIMWNTTLDTCASAVKMIHNHDGTQMSLLGESEKFRRFDYTLLDDMKACKYLSECPLDNGIPIRSLNRPIKIIFLYRVNKRISRKLGCLLQLSNEMRWNFTRWPCWLPLNFQSQTFAIFCLFLLSTPPKAFTNTPTP